MSARRAALTALAPAPALALVLALALGLAACADEVPAGSRLERTRLLAVVAGPVDEPARAWPSAGELAQVRALVVAPGQAPPVRWHLEVCCTAAGALAHTEDGVGDPVVRFAVPPEVHALRVAGVIEPQGEPATDFVYDLPVARDGVTNHHPRLAQVDLPQECAVAGGPVQTLRVLTAADARETYARADGGVAREPLRLSFFASAGELPRQFAVVEAADPAETSEVTMAWTPPPVEEVPPEGLTVRIVIVARDLRGGVDFTSRTLCVQH